MAGINRAFLVFITKYIYGRGIGEKLGLKNWYFRQMKKNAVAETTVNGFKMKLDKNDSLMLGYGRTFEPETTQFLLENVKKGQIAVDIGAHIGYYTLLLSKMVGEKGKVIAFEPVKENYEILQKNISLNGLKNIEAYNAAVSDKEGNAVFFERQNDSVRGSLIKRTDNYSHDQTATVKTVTLDSVVKKADWVKIDAEGAEHLILEGAKELLKTKPCMIIEYVEKKHTGILPTLEKYGYSLKKLDYGEADGTWGCNYYCE